MREMHGRKALIAGLCALGLGAVGASPALAQSSAERGYLEPKVDGRVLGDVEDVGQGNGAVQPAAHNSGENGSHATEAEDNLPFTGLDVGVLVALGAVLILTGLAIRRSGRETA